MVQTTQHAYNNVLHYQSVKDWNTHQTNQEQDEKKLLLLTNNYKWQQNKNSKYSSRIQCMSYYDKAHMDKLIKDVQLFCTIIFQFAPSKQQTSAYIHLISSINLIYEITGDHYGLSMCTEWCPNSNYSHNLCTEID